jgi:hypothetical protein
MVRLMFACCLSLNNHGMAGALVDGIRSNENGLETLGTETELGRLRAFGEAANPVITRFPQVGGVSRELAHAVSAKLERLITWERKKKFYYTSFRPLC